MGLMKRKSPEEKARRRLRRKRARPSFAKWDAAREERQREKQAERLAKMKEGLQPEETVEAEFRTAETLRSLPHHRASLRNGPGALRAGKFPNRRWMDSATMTRLRLDCPNLSSTPWKRRLSSTRT